MFCALLTSRYQMSVYRTNGPLVYVNNMKTFVCDYHLNPTTFLHHQIQVYSAHARILALGYKNAFSVLHTHGLVIFQHRAQIQNL